MGSAFTVPLRSGAILGLGDRLGGGLGGLRSYGGDLVRLIIAVVGIGFLVFVRLEEIGGVQEGALFLADIDKGGLDARQDRVHAAQIDVSDHAPLIGAVNQQFDEPIVLEDGHSRFARAPVD